MKTFISIIISATMLFASCSSNQSNETENNTNTTEQSLDKPMETGDFEEAENCDEFVDQYEEWTEEYLKLLDSYMKNPMDAKLAQKFMEHGQKASFWMNQWNSDLLSCASQEKYQERFDKITEKFEKKMEEFDIE